MYRIAKYKYRRATVRKPVYKRRSIKKRYNPVRRKIAYRRVRRRAY